MIETYLFYMFVLPFAAGIFLFAMYLVAWPFFALRDWIERKWVTKN